jgi:hypothetical protein
MRRVYVNTLNDTNIGRRAPWTFVWGGGGGADTEAINDVYLIFKIML